MKHTFQRPLAAVAATVVFFAASSALAQTAQTTARKPAPRTVDRVVAVVNDEVITANELVGRLRVAEDQLKRQNITPPARDVLTRQVLEQMIVQRAQLQLAKETGVRVDDASVNATIARIAESNGMTLPVLRERIEKEGISFARYREDIRDEILLGRLRDREVDSRIQVSEGEIDNFIAAQAGVKAGAVEYNLAQILLRVPDGSSAERIEAVRQRAEDLARQLRTGADFAQLAASYSAAPEALQGGELGWRTEERLPTLFVDAVKSLKPGQLGPIVRSPGGFHILKLVGQRNAAEARTKVTPIEQTRARHILLRVSDIAPEPEVRRRLADLRERVIKGNQDFGQLARLHSVDPSSTRGGDLGWLYPGDTVPEFERAMAALKINEVSEPIQSPFGWHLIQVLERRTEESPAERARLQARLALRERKAEEQYQEWLRQLRDRTYVEYRLEES
jgi:peptidyl-prolyl cis-trans isomerase SurA